MKALLSTVLFCLWAWHAHAQIASLPTGSGSNIDPYLIENLNHLYWMSSQSSATLSGKFFSQTNTIDASESSSWFPISGSPSGFPPIGPNPSTAFGGNYNGNGFAIDNLYINNPTLSYCGLFGCINGATIRNVNLTNANFTAGSYLGGIAGSIQYSTISNCSVSGSILSNGTNVGGIFGKGTYSNMISLCSSSGSISAQDKAGGLAGEISGSSILNCFSRSTITRTSGSGTNFGGAIGTAASTTFQYCYSTGAISYANAGNPINKGFAGGSNSCTFTAVYYDVNSSGQSSSAGGIGLSTSEMKNYQHFFSAGYDLRAESQNGTADFWALSENSNDGYPNLNKIQQLTFNQSVSDNWQIAENWTPVFLPDSLSDVLIPAGKSTIVAANSIAICRSLRVEETGLLKLSATAGKPAELNCQTISNDGNILQEMWIPGGWQTAGSNWHLIASPAGKIPISTLIPGTGEFDLYAWDEASASWINYKDNSNPLPFDDSLQIGKAYLVSYSQNQMLEFSGTPFYSAYQTPAYSNSGGTFGGWHLLGNPYPRSVRWKGDEISPLHTANIAKVWSSTNEAYQDLLPNDSLAKASGFFVYFDNSLKMNSGLDSPIGNFSLRLMDKSRCMEVHFLIHPDAKTESAAAWNATYLLAKDRQFYWQTAQNAYSSLAYPAVADTLELTLAIESESIQSYQIEISRQNLPVNLCLYDQKEKRCHSLLDGPYSFTHHPDDDKNRFILRMIELSDNAISSCCPDSMQIKNNEAVLALVHKGVIHYPPGWENIATELYDLQGRKAKYPVSGIYLLKRKR